MSYSGGIVSKPVTMTDIAQAVGNASRSLGYLITNGSIKKWAKKKPVRYDTNSAITDAQRKSANHSFSFTSYANLSSLMDAAVALGQSGEAWTYNRPRGVYSNVREPFRMLDFDGYNSNIISEYAPFRYILNPRVAILSDTITAQIDPTVPSSGVWSQSDFVDIDGKYIGCAFREHGRTGLPQAFTIENGTPSGLYTALQSGKLYDVAFFFSNRTISLDDLNPAGTYYLTPWPLSDIKRVSDPQDIFTSEAQIVRGTINLELHLTLKMQSGSRQFNSLSVHFIDGGGTQYTSHTLETSPFTLDTTGRSYVITASRPENDAWLTDGYFHALFNQAYDYEFMALKPA